MQIDPHTLSVIINFIGLGISVYVYFRWLREPKKQNAGEKSPLAPPEKSGTRAASKAAIYVVICSIIIGTIYFIPERMGRKDATAVCESISVGTRFRFDMESLNAYLKDQKSKYGTLFAANYYPKVKDVPDGNGAIIPVFLGGYPFSRAYCVLHLNEGAVESTRLMFNAEDYEYCNGEMRGIWECAGGEQK